MAVGNLADEVALADDDDDSDIEVLESVSFLDGDKFEDSVLASSSTSTMMMNQANSSMSSSMSRYVGIVGFPIFTFTF